MQTEDSGTQGEGNIELENGWSSLRSGTRRMATFQPQVSYGLTPRLDLIVQSSWHDSREEGGAAVRGWGDTVLDAKWRFFGTAPLSLAVRAGATMATRQPDPGGRIGLHAVGVATFGVAPFAAHANFGLTMNPGGSADRRHVGRVSGALTWATSQRLTLAVDIGAEANPNPARSAWPGNWLVAAIYTVHPGLNLDIGYQSGLGAAEPTRRWLAGLTFRFAP